MSLQTIPLPNPNAYPRYEEFSSQILNIGVSTSALFDTREEDRVFKEEGEIAYMQLMRERADTPFTPGVVLPFIKKMMAFNTPDRILTNFTILSRNNPQVAARVNASIHAHGLFMKVGKGKVRFGMGEAYMKGRAITPTMLRSFGVDLFLSPNQTDVIEALKADISAGQTLYGEDGLPQGPDTKNILVAFDFDRVLGLGKGGPKDKFKGDSEAYFARTNLLAYWKREALLATLPAHPGPFASFYLKLIRLRDFLKINAFPTLLEIAIVTARSSDPLTRIQTTLEHWGGAPMEADYLISSRKTPKYNHLKELKADIFFDDSEKHVKGAANVTAAVLVPFVEPAREEKKARIHDLHPSRN